MKLTFGQNAQNMIKARNFVFLITSQRTLGTATYEPASAQIHLNVSRIIFRQLPAALFSPTLQRANLCYLAWQLTLAPFSKQLSQHLNQRIYNNSVFQYKMQEYVMRIIQADIFSSEIPSEVGEAAFILYFVMSGCSTAFANHCFLFKGWFYMLLVICEMMYCGYRLINAYLDRGTVYRL